MPKLTHATGAPVVDNFTIQTVGARGPALLQAHLFRYGDTARSIAGASEEVEQRHIANCTRADAAYGAGVARAIAAIAKRD